jgi:hypothetical protein
LQKQLFTAVIVMLTILCLGHARAAVPVRPTTSKATAPNDAQIEKAIRARLAASKISKDQFTVHVQGGTATLEGKTDVIQHKGTATRLAKSGGAISVVNRIQISDSARHKAAENLAKGRRRAQIKRGETRSDLRSSQ